MTRAFTLGFFAGLGALLWHVRPPRRRRGRVSWVWLWFVERELCLRQLMAEEERRIFA